MGFDCWKKTIGDASLPSKACEVKSKVAVAVAGRRLLQISLTVSNENARGSPTTAGSKCAHSLRTRPEFIWNGSATMLTPNPADRLAFRFAAR
jgi:hypothetical protein